MHLPWNPEASYFVVADTWQLVVPAQHHVLEVEVALETVLDHEGTQSSALEPVVVEY